MKTQLVIMAAGIGSRFKVGSKQLTPVGKNGEVIMDYSVGAAVKAGFDEVVVIIRKDIEKEFYEIVGDRIKSHIPLKIVYQELDNLPASFVCPKERTKPFGTAHALYCAKDAIDSPFIVTNADDYYGEEGFKKIHDYLVNGKNTNIYDMCMASYILKNTISSNGAVTRGVCHKNEDNILTNVKETYEIERKADGIIKGTDGKGHIVELQDDTLVSMNMFGLPKEFLAELHNRFINFLNANIDDYTAEFLLPSVINDLIKENKGQVKVLPVNDVWYGMTYAEDKQYVIDALANVKAYDV